MVTSLMQNNKDQNEHRGNLLSDLALTQPEMMIDPSLKASPHSSSNETLDTSSTSKGHLDGNDSGTRYLGATNWTTVLQNVSLVINYTRPPSSLKILDT